MNWDLIRGKWKELKGRAKASWGRLTHQDLQVIAGRRDQLIGKVQQLYGLARNAAEKEVDAFGRRLKLRLKRTQTVARRKPKKKTAPAGKKRAVSKKR